MSNNGGKFDRACNQCGTAKELVFLHPKRTVYNNVEKTLIKDTLLIKKKYNEPIDATEASN